ncbi:thioredoxin b [Paramormyrops kingsleyae]|uniref:thioredoxin b n=1 Tax=Paramormyrops kingsleyae TaxID=1676925 RepID=UPI003B9758B3
MPYKRELDEAQIRLPNFIQERRDLGVQSVFKMIVVIENQEAFDKALRDAGDKLVVVDFTAVWCGPCQSIAPFYKSLSENPDYIQVVFLKVDVDDAQDVASFCDISCMPTFHFYKNGKKIDDFSGCNQAKLEEKLNNHK